MLQQSIRPVLGLTSRGVVKMNVATVAGGGTHSSCPYILWAFIALYNFIRN